MPRKPPKPRGGIVAQEYELVPVNSLQPHPSNVNEGDLGSVIESIEHNRFFGAVLAQKSTGRILAGKHRWLAAKDRGLEVVPVIWADVDDAEALRIMLADNRTCRLGSDNQDQLAGLLQSILSDTGSLAGTGFDGDFLDELLGDLAHAGDEPGGGDGPGDDASNGHAVTCPSCGHEFQAS